MAFTMASRLRLVLLTATAVASVPAIAQAQGAGAAGASAKEGDLGEIVVTARRTSESAQRVPVSITNVSANDLRYNVVQSATDLTKEAPSLRIASNVTSAAGLTIDMRGQTQTGTAANDTSSVGVYLDDLFLSSAQISGSVLNLHDLERVEVLKGAQGTLYGRNVTAGVVKFITNKPKDKYEGSFTAGLGNYDRRFIEGMVNIPLGSTAAVRLVGSVDDHGGYSYAPNTKREMDDQKKWNVRGSLSWKPTDRLSILLQGSYGEYSQSDSDARTTYIQPGVNSATMNVMAALGINGLTPAALSPIIFFGTAVRNGTATPSQLTAFGTAFAAATAALPQVYAAVDAAANAPRSQTQGSTRFTFPARTKAGNGALTIAYEIGDSATIRSITGYDYGGAKRYFDVGGGPWVPIYTNQNGYSKQFTEELQLTGTAAGSRLTYAAGLFYMHRESADNRQDSAEFGAFPLFLGQFGLGITNGSTQTNTSTIKSYAAYAQATYELVEGLRFTGGLRYTKEDDSVVTAASQKPQASNGFTAICIGPKGASAFPQCSASSAPSSFDAVTYTAGLDYTVAPDVMVYAKTSRGFKSGGLNVFTGAGADILGYKPEFTQDYEVGIKSRFFDRKVMLNATYYHTDYSNIQRAVSFEAGPNLILTATRNAAKAKIDGFEGELKVNPLPGLVLGGTLAYINGRYNNYSTVLVFPGPTPGTTVNVVQDLSGLKFQGLAPWTYTLSASYDVPTSFGNVHAQVNWAHRSSANLFENDGYATASGPATPFSETRQTAYGLLDTSLTFDLNQWHSSVTIWGKNVLNKRYRMSMISLSNNGVGYTWANYGDPATYGVDWTVKF